MAFTTAEKVDIRRHCGYPMFGGTPSSFQSYRFFQAYGTLEYRMSNMLAEEEAVVRTTYLANLTTLETAIPAASANLDTDQAAVWTHNKREVVDRDALFSNWRRKLCEFMGIPPGPGLSGDSGSVQLVV
ncbi:hypothetical protein [Ralstonia solanacearum]|uniref:hypothetical protein n=1 Tax=Ralstonia solanacearum TaxID=305 RepID=UPI003D802E0E